MVGERQMGIVPLKLQDNYWETFQIRDNDLEFLYNQLLDLEIPLTAQELSKLLVEERIRQEKSNLEKQQLGAGTIYRPNEHFEVGQELIFPSFNWQKGKVLSVRKGTNPDIETFEVIEVEFVGGQKKSFASSLQNHKLNEPLPIDIDDPLLNPVVVIKLYGRSITARLAELLEANSDLVQIAGSWFPRALLVDVNAGHLNLAEAVLEMAEGGPLTTRAIIEQIELPTDVNPRLTEFSLNLALQEDSRFDEIGPAGEILWFLHRLEPSEVQNPPTFLHYHPVDYENASLETYIKAFGGQCFDELEYPIQDLEDDGNDITVSLIYPHWRAGTLPLTGHLAQLFPTAYESPRIQFEFIDTDTQKRFPGWVVRPNRYVYGLKEWYLTQNTLPGSLIHLRRGNKPGEIQIHLGKKHPTREWIRTLIIGADGGFVFAMLKQQIYTEFDERMIIFIKDVADLSGLWEQSNSPKTNLDLVISQMMRQLSKLSPQSHVHAQELYAAVNLVRRCPPGAILHSLFNRPWAVHLGDLYFRLEYDNQE